MLVEVSEVDRLEKHFRQQLREMEEKRQQRELHRKEVEKTHT